MDPLQPYGGHGPHAIAEQSFMLPFLGSFLLLALLLSLAAFYLVRQGKLTLPQLGRRSSPEEDAKRILADRFARGDIDSEEFLERSSMLNWTPGSQPTPVRSRKRR